MTGIRASGPQSLSRKRRGSSNAAASVIPSISQQFALASSRGESEHLIREKIMGTWDYCVTIWCDSLRRTKDLFSIFSPSFPRFPVTRVTHLGREVRRKTSLWEEELSKKPFSQRHWRRKGLPMRTARAGVLKITGPLSCAHPPPTPPTPRLPSP